MPGSLARICFVLAQTNFGSNLLDAKSDGVQLGRDLISGLRQGGLENVPYVCYLTVQESLSFTVCDIVLAVRVSIDSYYFVEYPYRPNTESAIPRRRPSASTA